jgi:hypothetical protein
MNSTTTGGNIPIQQTNQPSNVCPHCGYCPHCGRGGHVVAPYVVPYPVYPYYPVYPTLTVTATGNTDSNGIVHMTANNDMTFSGTIT